MTEDTAPVQLRSLAEQLASEAAAFVRKRRVEVFGAGGGGASAAHAVRSKSTATDPVTVVDTETERLLRGRLAELRPGERILGEEEGGPTGGADGELTWVLDPIDGTVNFLYGIEAYAVSVGVQRGGASVAGAVADVAAGAVYSAALGHGARLRRDGVVTELRCSAVTELPMALVGTGFGYRPEVRRRQGQIVAELLPQVRDLRRIGSCALDLCMVAAGRLDAYYEDGVHVWDWAAGALIAGEAGADVRLPSSLDGPGFVVTAAPGISAALDAALAGCGAL
ncbi:inositol monophosphatase family protein [Mycolicibacterium hippocampi]|uniref:inositol-phosphate phosphatase n=1 Tax=Mycolicibacterium hippocampi TaxID=659824 RepID=A0A7I9ZP09_9MYCO|nr:inositol monophosphatase family protein [Mycolicibacterium hippocampi]GFH02725.1 inositol monophosphatase [Mycolicibacterium hippocampi]